MTNPSVKSGNVSEGLDKYLELTPISEGVWVGSLDAHLNDLLAHDIERLLAASQETSKEGSRLSYVYVEGLLCMLTPYINVFSPNTLGHLKFILGSVVNYRDDRCLVSTPQLRLFVKGSFRAWGTDQIPDGLHYLMVIGIPGCENKMHSTLEIALQDTASVTRGEQTSSGVASIELTPGRVVLHKTSLQYKLSAKNESSDPCRALTMVDGYIW